MSRLRILSILFLGVFLGVTTNLFINIVSQHGILPVSGAAGLPKPPFVCINCNLNGADSVGPGNTFTGVNLKSAFIPGIQSSGNDFSGTNFTDTILPALQSVGDTFSGAKFNDANLDSMNVNSSDFTGADFIGAKLTNAVEVASTNFTNANFTNANLSTSTTFWGTGGNTFTGAIWSNTTCPDGTNSNSDGGTCVNNLN